MKDKYVETHGYHFLNELNSAMALLQSQLVLKSGNLFAQILFILR